MNLYARRAILHQYRDILSLEGLWIYRSIEPSGEIGLDLFILENRKPLSLVSALKTFIEP